MVGKTRLYISDSTVVLDPQLDNGTFNLIGRVFRHSQYKPTGAVDVSFLEFTKKNGNPLNLSHQWGSATLEAEMPSVAKYAKYQYYPIDQVDIGAARLAEEWLHLHFGPIMVGAVPTENAAVWMEMDKSTSPGYPWSVACATKLQAFVKGVKEYSEVWFASLGHKPVNEPVWTSSVKAEMLPHEKIEGGRRRTFTASPTEMTFASNKLCLDMNARMFRAGASHKIWSAVGVNIFEGGWNRMALRLLGNGRKRGYAFDASQYDSSLGTYIFRVIRDYRKWCLGEKFDLPMDLLYHFIVNSVIVLTDGTLVQKSTGNPSGSGNTTPDNTLALFFLFAFAYIRTYMKRFKTVPKYEKFMEDCAAVLYGDDSLIMCTEECLTWFTGECIVDSFRVFGVTLTPEGGVLEPQPLNKLSFLSSTFHFNETHHMWVPVPHAEKILSSMLFGGSSASHAVSLYRAQSLLLVSYWNPVCRRILSGYIQYMHRTGTWMLETTSNITQQDIMSTYRTEKELQYMWLAQESDVQSEERSMHLEYVLKVLLDAKTYCKENQEDPAR